MNTKNILTKEEIDQLKGGYTPIGLDDVDVHNINKVYSCVCEFNNYGVIVNDNQIAGCTCKCV